MENRPVRSEAVHSDLCDVRVWMVGLEKEG